ncbi:MucR family transcriptional regulator [Rhizobium herbae]|uniref:MucR family transcriptional regulator n=1 Tax=Rhizobium herbae TaxID=508661 RepID=A0ABS7HCY8_9HYPH|nr:MucR family transcriptional regulator [Rhizobium herbae]MBW9064655.1 MucR family transcriptional regulator [Rhizobium herbae]
MNSKPENPSPENISELTANIVTAYVSRHDVSLQDLPGLIVSVQNALEQNPRHIEAPLIKIQQPAVPIKKSIQKDYIVCLEDGRKFRSLKRHLKSSYNLTPDEYRVKWGLPPEYPMVAPSYATARSKIAKDIGLGVTVSKRSTRAEE